MTLLASAAAITAAVVLAWSAFTYARSAEPIDPERLATIRAEADRIRAHAEKMEQRSTWRLHAGIAGGGVFAVAGLLPGGLGVVGGLFGLALLLMSVGGLLLVHSGRRRFRTALAQLD